MRAITIAAKVKTVESGSESRGYYGSLGGGSRSTSPDYADDLPF